MVQLSEEELKLLQSIFTKHQKNLKVWIFGSRAKGTSEHYSDLDLLLKCKEKIPLSDLSKLSESLEKSSLTFKVELVDWHRITPEFQEQIMKNWVRLI